MRHLTTYKLFESTVDDLSDEKLCARSDDWCLYRFDDVYDMMDFENSIGLRGKLTRGPFSVPEDANQDTIGYQGTISLVFRFENFYKDII